jgi:hypothetical protein
MISVAMMLHYQCCISRHLLYVVFCIISVAFRDICCTLCFALSVLHFATFVVRNNRIRLLSKQSLQCAKYFQKESKAHKRYATVANEIKV